jgi:parallel beta helix pectate lyase-like protein
MRIVAAVVLVSLLGRQDKKEILLAPGQDLAAAVAQAGSGSLITLAGGAYAPGQITFGPSAAGVSLRSKPGQRAQIDFGGRGGFYLKADGVTLKDLDILNAQNFAVDIDGSTCTLDGCRILGSGGDAVKLSPGNWQAKKYNHGATIVNCEIGANKAFEGIDCVGQDDVRILNCHFHDTPGWGVYLKGGAARGLIEGCVFERTGTLANNPAGGVCLGEHTGPDGVMTNKHGEPWESVDSVVRNCVFVDIPGPALAAWCARGSRFFNNTCINAATKDRAALIVLANHNLPCRDVAFVNNIVVGSKEGNRPLVWIYANGASEKVVFENNTYWGGNGKFWNQAAGAGPVDFEAWKSAQDRDSLFADPKLDDQAHLAAGSPCINKGKTIAGFAIDFDGGKREGPWDIGADEFRSGTIRKLLLRR